MIDPADIVSTLKSDGIDPLSNSIDDGEYAHLIEAWKNDKKISIYIGEDELLIIRVWGPNIHDEMSEHKCTPTGLAVHLSWLQGEDY